jgi:hypothetical protein
MIYSQYHTIVLEAVTQGSKVCGYPSRVLVRSAKTILFITLIALSNSFADDLVAEVSMIVNKFNGESPINVTLSRGYENAKDSEIRIKREQEEAMDVALNKAETRDGRYWVDGRWVCPSKTYELAETKNDLKDSDNDGYDDYTEFVNGTNPKDNKSFPAMRNGNNKRIFK